MTEDREAGDHPIRKAVVAGGKPPAGSPLVGSAQAKASGADVTVNLIEPTLVPTIAVGELTDDMRGAGLPL